MYILVIFYQYTISCTVNVHSYATGREQSSTGKKRSKKAVEEVDEDDVPLRVQKKTKGFVVPSEAKIHIVWVLGELNTSISI